MRSKYFCCRVFKWEPVDLGRSTWLRTHCDTTQAYRNTERDVFRASGDDCVRLRSFGGAYRDGTGVDVRRWCRRCTGSWRLRDFADVHARRLSGAICVLHGRHRPATQRSPAGRWYNVDFWVRRTGTTGPRSLRIKQLTTAGARRFLQ